MVKTERKNTTSPVASWIDTTLIQAAIAKNTPTEATFSRMPRSAHSGSATTR
jgi:hypothetical protein